MHRIFVDVRTVGLLVCLALGLAPWAGAVEEGGRAAAPGAMLLAQAAPQTPPVPNKQTPPLGHRDKI